MTAGQAGTRSACHAHMVTWGMHRCECMSMHADESEEEEEPAAPQRGAGRRGAAVKAAPAAAAAKAGVSRARATPAAKAGRGSGKATKKGAAKAVPMAGATLKHLFTQSKARAAADGRFAAPALSCCHGDVR